MASEFSLDTKGFEQMLRVAAERLRQPIAADITVRGEAAEYALVLEHGSRAGNRPWPEAKRKTVRSGDGRIRSKQAPRGYVGRHAKQFLKFLRDAFRKRVRGKVITALRDGLVDAANETAERGVELIEASVPVDTGKLRDSIVVKEAK